MKRIPLDSKLFSYEPFEAIQNHKLPNWDENLPCSWHRYIQLTSI